MAILTFLLYFVHVVVCLFLILVVLLQQGKGADLSVFGGGSTQTAFGARGATTLLHKLTVGSFVIFIITTLAIGLPKLSGSGSVLHGVPAGKSSSTAPVIPGAPAAPASKAPAAPAPAQSTAPVAPAAPAPAAPPR